MTDARISGSRRAMAGLDALNLLIAMREGFWPYLTMFLVTTYGPAQGSIALSAVALAGLLAQTPAGVLVDQVPHKRAILVVAALVVGASALLLPFVASYGLVLATQCIGAIAASVFLPAVAGMTLGLVGPQQFAGRVGRNEAFRHAGKVIAAAVAVGLFAVLGSTAVFWALAFATALGIGATLFIPAREIDEDMARGYVPIVGSNPTHARRSRPGIEYLALFALLVLIFQLAHGATVMSYSRLAMKLAGGYSTALLLYVPLAAAVLVMIPVALLVGFTADRIGRKPIFVAAFGVLAVRCALYAVADTSVWLVALQLLDGVCLGIYGVLFSVVVADLTRGTGFFNAALGVAATVQKLGGWVAVSLAPFFLAYVGEPAAYLWLAGIAAVGFALYLLVMPETRRADASTGVADTFA